MFNRSPETDELLRDPLALALLAQIAIRARWRTAFSSDGLEIGEALIGDHKSLGMTRAEYRTRIDRLKRWQQITTRTTNKGTIAKLISTVVFDINAENIHRQNNQQRNERSASKQPTNDQQIANGEPLTNKGRRKEGEKEIKKNAVAGRKDAALEIAATTTDSTELTERLQELYSSLSVYTEWLSYSRYRDRLGKAKTGITFVEWLEKAHPRIQDNRGLTPY